MTEENVNMAGVSIDENNKEQLTDLQEYGINSAIIRLLGDLRKYMILTQMQMDLKQKSHQVQPIMREIHQYEEVKMIMDIRTDLDYIHGYTRDKIILTNMESIRTKFESAIHYLTSNMVNVKSPLDKDFTEILDEFLDKLKMLTEDIATKSIYDEHFKLQ